MYDAASGQRVAHASPIKVTGPVRSCGLSADCRHLCAVVGKGFVFRFEYLGEQQQQAAEVSTAQRSAAWCGAVQRCQPGKPRPGQAGDAQ